MNNSIKKYNKIIESGKIKESEVYEYTCFCTNNSNCTNCARPKSYLVSRWVENSPFEMEGQPDTYRFEDKSLEYINGFIEGLEADATTSSVHLTEVKE